MSDSKDTVPTYSERYYDDLYEYRRVAARVARGAAQQRRAQPAPHAGTS